MRTIMHLQGNSLIEDLKRMAIFAYVVEAQSFSGAAKKLGIAKSAVSKHVSVLEEHIGVRLLNRTTRGISLTDVGEQYYAHCTRIIEASEEADELVSPLHDKPQGTLRIATPITIGEKYIAPLLNAFLQQHQTLKAELLLDDNIVDLVQENIDVAIRIGWLNDSNLKARKLRDAKLYLCASPEYIKRIGEPKTLDDLKKHEWIIFTLLPAQNHCTFKKRNESKTIQINGRIKTNNGSAVRKLALEGTGIATLSDITVSQDIKQGKLVHLLPEYEISSAGVYAVYKEQRYLQAKTRQFIDYLVKNMGE